MMIKLSPALGILAIAIIGHIVATVWWAARITTILSLAQTSLAEITADIRAHKLNSVTKEDMARELAISEKEHKAIWKNIDELKDKVFSG